ncbi:frataxin homolog, mitochondrial [Venturia canescens]|uniref:frataxin homolog, mitochondrial n=1 Tax=Venturia canescens TaxID=32260 RepID=UPI001C9D2CF6|nr:frataxin homolog, mitochondrial [Venturia canescens]
MTRELDSLQFDKISEETLESLTEYFDELVEKAEHLKEADVSYGDGVLTIKFGKDFGTYVINRQTPNRQIWLSSPKSGPKRYDFIAGKWIYKHDGRSIHELLDDEIPKIVKSQTNFRECPYSGRK